MYARSATAHVVVLALMPETWNCFTSVVRAVERHPDLRCTVVAVRSRIPARGTHESIDRVTPALRAQGIDAVLDLETSLAELRPDVVLTNCPYPAVYPEGWTLEEIQNHARLVYLPYAIELFGDEFDTTQYRLDIHRSAWRILGRSETFRSTMERYLPGASERVRVVGSPKLDHFFMPSPKSTPEEILGRSLGPEDRVVLWNPSFPDTVNVNGQKRRGWSTFLTFVKTMIEAAHREPRLVMVCRPHPNLRNASLESGAVSADFWEHFDRFAARQPNFIVHTDPDYYALMKIADAMVSDTSSFLYNFLPTGKPICHTFDPEGIAFADRDGIGAALYGATRPEQVEVFLADVLAGRDPLCEARERATERALYLLDGRAGERVAEMLARELGSLVAAG